MHHLVFWDWLNVWEIRQLIFEVRRTGEQRDNTEGGGTWPMARCPPLILKRTGLGDKQPLHSYLVLWAVSPLGSFAVFRCF